MTRPKACAKWSGGAACPGSAGGSGPACGCPPLARRMPPPSDGLVLRRALAALFRLVVDDRSALVPRGSPPDEQDRSGLPSRCSTADSARLNVTRGRSRRQAETSQVSMTGKTGARPLTPTRRRSGGQAEPAAAGAAARRVLAADKLAE